MSEVVDASGLTPDFLQLRLSSSARHELALLEHALGDVALSNLLDGRWMASSSLAICTLAIYAALQGRVSGPHMSELNWEGFAPKKVKIFFWILPVSMKTWMGHLFASCPCLLPFWARLLHAETCTTGDVATESVVGLFFGRLLELRHTTALAVMWTVWKIRNRKVFVNVTQGRP
jgi:hypothetical protein